MTRESDNVLFVDMKVKVAQRYKQFDMTKVTKDKITIVKIPNLDKTISIFLFF